MIRILLDQGLPRGTAQILCREQWDVVHTGDIGLAQASDREIIDFAQREDRIIITLARIFHESI